MKKMMECSKALLLMCLRKLIKELLDLLLSSKRLLQVRKQELEVVQHLKAKQFLFFQELLLKQNRSDEVAVLTVQEFLTRRGASKFKQHV